MTWVKLDQKWRDHRVFVAALGELCWDTTEYARLLGHFSALCLWAVDSADEGGPLTAAEVAWGAKLYRRAQRVRGGVNSRWCSQWGRSRLLDRRMGRDWR